MNKYELVVILDAQKSSSEKEEIYKKIQEEIAKSGGRVLNGQVWLEKHRMTFSLKRKTEGTYYTVNFQSESPYLIKIKEFLRLNEDILRYLIVKARV